MYQLRRDKLKKLLIHGCKKDNAMEYYDIVLIDSPENLYYYTGFTGGEALLIMSVSNEKLFIITDSRYYEQVQMECPDITLIRLEGRTYTETVKELLSDELFGDYSTGLNNIAIEETMNLSRYMKLRDTLKSFNLIIAGNLINEPRMVKDDDELKLLRRAEQIGDEAFSHILTILKPGITESEISLELEFFMKRQGASKLSFDTIVASGPNSSMPHAQVTDRVIQNGDFVTMDFGCVYKGYCSDMTRTVAIGEPTDEMKKVYQVVLDANLRAMDGIRSGVICSDIDSLARDYIKEHGYGEYFGHGLGHGVGLYIHEEPRFSPKCHVVTKENMTITDEPGIYLPGRFGVRIEDLVLVKKDGCEKLSKSPKELIII